QSRRRDKAEESVVSPRSSGDFRGHCLCRIIIECHSCPHIHRISGRVAGQNDKSNLFNCFIHDRQSRIRVHKAKGQKIFASIYRCRCCPVWSGKDRERPCRGGDVLHCHAGHNLHLAAVCSKIAVEGGCRI